MDYLHPKHSPLVDLVSMWNGREPDMVIGEFKIHLHRFVPVDMLYAFCGNNVVVNHDGLWRNLTREEFEARIKEVLQQ